MIYYLLIGSQVQVHNQIEEEVQEVELEVEEEEEEVDLEEEEVDSEEEEVVDSEEVIEVVDSEEVIEVVVGSEEEEVEDDILLLVHKFVYGSLSFQLFQKTFICIIHCLDQLVLFN